MQDAGSCAPHEDRVCAPPPARAYLEVMEKGPGLLAAAVGLLRWQAKVNVFSARRHNQVPAEKPCRCDVQELGAAGFNSSVLSIVYASCRRPAWSTITW